MTSIVNVTTQLHILLQELAMRQRKLNLTKSIADQHRVDEANAKLEGFRQCLRLCFSENDCRSIEKLAAQP